MRTRTEHTTIPFECLHVVSYRLVSSYQLNARFLYSVTIYIYIYYITTLNMFRAVPLTHLQEDKLYYYGLQSALNRHTIRPFTESDDIRGCNNTICPPVDE